MSAQASLTRLQQAAKPKGYHLVRRLMARAASVCVVRSAAASMAIPLYYCFQLQHVALPREEMMRLLQ
jgi:hypothetical protein